MAPAHSKPSRLDYYSPDDSDVSFNTLVPQDAWLLPPRSKNRPVTVPIPTSRNPALSGAAPTRQNSRHPDFAIDPTLDQTSYRARVSEDRRSPSYISISSDSSDETGTELNSLREENDRLKVECGNLRGQVTGLTYVSYLLHHMVDTYILSGMHTPGSSDPLIKTFIRQRTMSKEWSITL